MFVVAVGNAFEGLTLFVDSDNKPFPTEKAAYEFGDLNYDNFHIIPVHTPEALEPQEENCGCASLCLVTDEGESYS